jgi:hypothetical protein
LRKERSVGAFDTSPLQWQLQNARSVAANILQWCTAKQLDDLAFVFSAYAEGQAMTTENLLDQVAPLLCSEWFLARSSLAFGHLFCLLEKGLADINKSFFLCCALSIGPIHAYGKCQNPPCIFGIFNVRQVNSSLQRITILTL